MRGQSWETWVLWHMEDPSCPALQLPREGEWGGAHPSTLGWRQEGLPAWEEISQEFQAPDYLAELRSHASCHVPTFAGNNTGYDSNICSVPNSLGAHSQISCATLTQGPVTQVFSLPGAGLL